MASKKELGESYTHKELRENISKIHKEYFGKNFVTGPSDSLMVIMSNLSDIQLEMDFQEKEKIKQKINSLKKLIDEVMTEVRLYDIANFEK